jgi:hypothetical protein
MKRTLEVSDLKFSSKDSFRLGFITIISFSGVICFLNNALMCTSELESE